MSIRKTISQILLILFLFLTICTAAKAQSWREPPPPGRQEMSAEEKVTVMEGTIRSSLVALPFALLLYFATQSGVIAAAGGSLIFFVSAANTPLAIGLGIVSVWYAFKTRE